jgi:hypothetical protein
MFTQAANPWSTTAAAIVRAVSSLPQVVKMVMALVMGKGGSAPVLGLVKEFATPWRASQVNSHGNNRLLEG